LFRRNRDARPRLRHTAPAPVYRLAHAGRHDRILRHHHHGQRHHGDLCQFELEWHSGKEYLCQDFNKNAALAREWAREGFKGDLVYKDGRISYRLDGPEALVSRLTEITAIFHRPVGEKQDFTLKLPLEGKATFGLDRTLAGGRWIVDLAAVENGQTVYHQAVRITVLE
jgi:FixH